MALSTFIIVLWMLSSSSSIIFFEKTATLCVAAGNSSATIDGFSTDDANPERLSPATVAAQFVTAHNAARRAVGVPPVSWDSKLATFAKAYAGERRGDCELVHSPGYAYGENVFWGQGRRWRVPDAVQAWVDERRWYDYDTNSCAGEDCSHYTQVVWRNTRKIGCAKIVCKTGDTFIVCEYYPPGNYVGARPYIIRPKS